MYFSRTHFSLVPSVLFLVGLAAVAVPLLRGSIGPWQAAELSVYGILLGALVYLARNLVRLRREVWSSRLRIDAQGLECGELAADDREEVAARMDALMERLSRAAGSPPRAQRPASGDHREETAVPQPPAEVGRADEETMAPVGGREAASVVRPEAAGAAP